MEKLRIFALGCCFGFIFGVMFIFICQSFRKPNSRITDNCDSGAPEGGVYRAGTDYKPQNKTDRQP